MTTTRAFRSIGGAAAAAVLLAGCDAVSGLVPGAGASGPAGAERVVDGDVEAPDAFQVRGDGIWNGRPSFSGVWVAYSDVESNERVIIRRTDGAQSVIGSLFRRGEGADTDAPFQISSDAAEALGLGPGERASLEVTALRERSVVPDDAAAAIETAPGDIEVVALPAASPASAAPRSNLSDPYLQIGTFSLEANAERAAERLRGIDAGARVMAEQVGGETSYRVTTGPSGTEADRTALLTRVMALGYADAYAVRN